MPTRHRTTFETGNKFSKRECPKELSAKLRDPRCRADGKDYEINKRGPPIPPTPTPGPSPGPPTPTPSSGGSGGLTPAEIAAITGGSLLGAAAIGYGAYSAVNAMKSYDQVGQDDAGDFEMTQGGSEAPVQAEMAPIEETEDIGPTEEDLLTALGKGAGGEGWGGSETAGMTLAKAKEASPTYVNPEEDPTITGEADTTPAVQTATATDSGELAAVPKGSGATFTTAPTTTTEASAQMATLGTDVEGGVSETAGVDLSTSAGFAEMAGETELLGGGPEDALADVVAGGLAAVAVGSAIVSGLGAVLGFGQDDTAAPVSQNSSGIGNGDVYNLSQDDTSDYTIAATNALASAYKTASPSDQTEILNTMNTLSNQTTDQPVYMYTDSNGNTQFVQRLSTQELAQSILDYQQDPNTFQGQDPNKLALEGLNPLMAQGESEAKQIGGKWVPNGASANDTESQNMGVPRSEGNTYLSGVDNFSLTPTAQDLYNESTIKSLAGTTTTSTTSTTSATSSSNSTQKPGTTTSSTTSSTSATSSSNATQKPATASTSATSSSTSTTTSSSS